MQYIKLILLQIPIALLSNCAFKFEITSQRTALENQIVGSYGEVKNDFVFADASGATGWQTVDSKVKSEGNTDESVLTRVQRSRDFNRDDIDDLKDEQILGENNEGHLVALPRGVGRIDDASPLQMKMARLVLGEENRSRDALWKYTVEKDSASGAVKQTVDIVRKEFIKTNRSQAKAGHWLQDDKGDWSQKAFEQNNAQISQ